MQFTDSTGSGYKKGTTRRAKRPAKKRIATVPWMFMLPGMLLFGIWMAYPLVKAFQISLYDWNPIPGAVSAFVGAANYLRAFDDPIFWLALRNTFVYTVVTVAGQIVLGLSVAVLVDKLVITRNFFRTIYYIPVVTSWVVVSILFKYLFNSSNAGLVNYLMVDVFHVLPDTVYWLSNAGTAWVAIMSLGIWKGIGWNMVIFLAALQGIPVELYEIASIDGANGFQRFWRITLPLIRPTLVFVLVMLVIGGFQAFTSIYLMTGGDPMQRTEVVLSYMYNQGFKYLDFGYGAALSYLLAVLIFGINITQMRILQKPVEY
jgi:multiple sugar transport system permease protein